MEGMSEHRWKVVALTLLALLFLRAEPSSVGVQEEGSSATARALLVRACQALEEDRWDEAHQTIFELRALAPGRPEPLLLEKLLAQRRSPFAPSWGAAFVKAWVELGRPDLSDSPLLPPAPSPHADVSALGISASLKAKVERWPLPVLWEDLESSRARDEVRWLRAFTGHADLP